MQKLNVFHDTIDTKAKCRVGFEQSSSEPSRGRCSAQESRAGPCSCSRLLNTYVAYKNCTLTPYLAICMLHILISQKYLYYRSRSVNLDCSSRTWAGFERAEHKVLLEASSWASSLAWDLREACARAEWNLCSLAARLVVNPDLGSIDSWAHLLYVKGVHSIITDFWPVGGAIALTISFCLYIVVTCHQTSH